MLFFNLAPCLVVAVQPCMGLMTIKKKKKIGWSCSVDFRHIVLPSFSISDLLFVFSLDVDGTFVLVIACVIFCAFVMLLIEVLIHVDVMLCFYRGTVNNG